MACGLIASLVASVLGGCGEGRAERLGFEWVRDDRPGYARLALVRPGQPGEAVVLGCQPRSGAVELTVAMRPGDPAVLTLRSGHIWNRYQGVGRADPARPGVLDVQVRLAETDPVLRALADNGELAIETPRRRMVAPNAFAPAHDLLAECRLGA